MADVVKENVTPTLIENTTMLLGYVNGVARAYEITPNDGYVLHDRLLDEFEEFDEETGEGMGEPIRLRCYEGTRTVGADYDFSANPREFFAVLRSEVDENKDERGDSDVH